MAHLCVWNCFLRFVNKKYEINCRIIASRTKRKFTTLREQDASLKALYNEVDEGEESFRGNWFIDENDIDDDYELESGSDINEAENEADVTEVEQETEQIEEKKIKYQMIPKILQQFNENKSSKLFMMF